MRKKGGIQCYSRSACLPTMFHVEWEISRTRLFALFNLFVTFGFDLFQ